MSARATDSMMTLHSDMYEDSELAKKCTLGRTKYSYLLCFGIAPYLEEKLIDQLKKAPEFVVMFDEALNKVSMRCQMDIIVRFWDENELQIVSKYLSSKFLGHTKATDLLAAFCSSLERVGLRKLIAVSMDGPNVNWALLTQLNDLRNLENFPELINVGSCGLHIVHGAAGVGHKASGWNLHEVFSSGYYLFNYTPLRRTQFEEITASSVFPLKFCHIRWVENMKVAKRYLDIVPNLKKYCSEVTPKPVVVSFHRTQKALEDPLLKAKLGFFVSVCQTVEPFLRRFQTEKPMIPFLYDALIDIQTTLARR